MVDALVGLSLCASVLTLSLAAGATAVRLGARAGAVERERAELIRRLDGAPAEPGERSGETADFGWTVTVEKPDAAVSADLCRVRIELTPRIGARLKVATLRPCRVEG